MVFWCLQLRNTSSYRRELQEGFYLNQTFKNEILKDLSKVSIYFKTTTVTHIEEQPMMKEYDFGFQYRRNSGTFYGYEYPVNVRSYVNLYAN